MDPLETPNRSLNLLYQPFKDAVNSGLGSAQQSGLQAFVFEGYRTKARQDWLYRQGRSRPGKIVTKAQGGQSDHQYGLAVDIVFKDNAGEWTWDGDYEHLAAFLKPHGLVWYGDPNSGFDEMPHFRWDTSIKIPTFQSMLQNGHSILECWALLDDESAKKKR